MIKKYKMFFSEKNAKKNIISKYLYKLFRLGLLFALGYVVLFPVLFMLSNSLRSNVDAIDPTIIWIPKKITFTNFKLVMGLLDFWKSFANTVIISVGSAVLQIMVSAFTGYGFAKYKFKGRGILFAMVLLTMVVPQQVLVMPMYLNYRFFDFFGVGSLIGLFTGNTLSINLLDTYGVFFIPSILGVGLKGGLFIYIFRQFFRNMPNEIMSSAKIDGCGHIKIFSRIMFPNAIPAIVTVFLFSTVWHWSDVYYTSRFLNKNITLVPQLTSLRAVIFRAMTSTNASIANLFTGDAGSIDSILQAGTLLIILPVLLLYLVAQKFFVQSVERTGIVE